MHKYVMRCRIGFCSYLEDFVCAERLLPLFFFALAGSAFDDSLFACSVLDALAPLCAFVDGLLDAWVAVPLPFAVDAVDLREELFCAASFGVLSLAEATAS